VTARVMVVADVAEGKEAEFEAAYAQVAAAVKGTPGHVTTSCSASKGGLGGTSCSASGKAWTRSSPGRTPIHREITVPMRRYWAGRVERFIYEVAAGMPRQVATYA